MLCSENITMYTKLEKKIYLPLDMKQVLKPLAVFVVYVRILNIVNGSEL